MDDHRVDMTTEEDGMRHMINNFIQEMSIRMISTKVEAVSHKKHVVR